MNIMVTGVAGFIGMHVTKELLNYGHTVVGIDNLNEYYDPKLKLARLSEVSKFEKFKFFNLDIANCDLIEEVFKNNDLDRVVHLAAQAGVRYSISNPSLYIQSNLVGFANIIEICRVHRIKQFVYASSSSVYGSNAKLPFSIKDRVDSPISLYAATKRSNELIAHSYSHLYGLHTVGLRFFTVYGPWGRPDMSTWLFTSAILEGRSINVFNNGEMSRDFTYIADVVSGILSILGIDNNRDGTPKNNEVYRLYNVGNNRPTNLLEYVHKLEKILGVKAVINFMPLQPGDIQTTYADIDDIKKDIGFHPKTSIGEGLTNWVRWYKKYKNI
jgi:UDP-glucuronate 4-epimerase